MGYLPWLLVVCVAVAGFVWRGGAGALVGGVVTYWVLIIAGRVVRKTTGGILPRKLREETARGFAAEYGEAVAKAFPNEDEQSRLRSVELLLEQIFQRSHADNTSMNVEKGDTRGAVRGAAEALIREEKLVERREVIDLLETYVEEKWYPPLALPGW